MNREQLRSKICVSIAESSVEACLAALHGVEFAEVRLDAIDDLTTDQVGRLFDRGLRRVATCRPCLGDGVEREAVLLAAIHAGASFVDIELDAVEAVRDRVKAAAREAGCDVIVSHHDHESTPPTAELRTLVDACFAAGADVAKIACQVDEDRDAARLLGVLDDPRRIIVIGMGPRGVVTRVLGPVLGSDFTFASLRRGAETAPGQLDGQELELRIRSVIDALAELPSGSSSLHRGKRCARGRWSS